MRDAEFVAGGGVALQENTQPVKQSAAPAKPVALRKEEVRREPLVRPIQPTQIATQKTEPIVYDRKSPPPLTKCFTRRKILVDGKTGFVVGYDLGDWANPQVEIM